ncbi:MAG: molybdopterin-dependent oxidoreductase [Deltaproteobacteria bacterium]|nr:molybdopterin-dependent oxidoreductase [Deltaproteobacteria bacterium]
MTDRKFIEERTKGFEQLEALVEGYTPQTVEEITGVNRDLIISAARVYGKAQRAMIAYTLGITEHSFGTDNVFSLVNLALLTGNFGKEGTGVNPLRGQANVQGTGDMGLLPPVLTGFQSVSDGEKRSKFEKEWGVSIPAAPGLTLSEMLLSPAGEEIRGMYIVGANPAVSAPSLKSIKKRLDRLDLLIVQDIFPTETATFADVVFPACSFAEKDGTFTNTERKVQRIRKAINPAGQAMADWEIIRDLSKQMGYEMNYSSPEEIFNEIRRLTPPYQGISYQRIEEDGIKWPCPDEAHPGTEHLHQDSFPIGRALFMPVEHRLPMENPDADYPFMLLTGRDSHHAHTGTMTRRSKTLSSIVPEAYVEINPLDAAAADVKNGEDLKITSRRGEVILHAYITDRVSKGVLFMPFHFSETSANTLTGVFLDPRSKMPEFKNIPVRMSKF